MARKEYLEEDQGSEDQGEESQASRSGIYALSGLVSERFDEEGEVTLDVRPLGALRVHC